MQRPNEVNYNITKAKSTMLELLDKELTCMAELAAFARIISSIDFNLPPYSDLSAAAIADLKQYSKKINRYYSYMLSKLGTALEFDEQNLDYLDAVILDRSQYWIGQVEENLGRPNTYKGGNPGNSVTLPNLVTKIDSLLKKDNNESAWQSISDIYSSDLYSVLLNEMVKYYIKTKIVHEIYILDGIKRLDMAAIPAVQRGPRLVLAYTELLKAFGFSSEECENTDADNLKQRIDQVFPRLSNAEDQIIAKTAKILSKGMSNNIEIAKSANDAAGRVLDEYIAQRQAAQQVKKRKKNILTGLFVKAETAENQQLTNETWNTIKSVIVQNAVTPTFRPLQSEFATAVARQATTTELRVDEEANKVQVVDVANNQTQVCLTRIKNGMQLQFDENYFAHAADGAISDAKKQLLIDALDSFAQMPKGSIITIGNSADKPEEAIYLYELAKKRGLLKDNRLKIVFDIKDGTDKAVKDLQKQLRVQERGMLILQRSSQRLQGSAVVEIEGLNSEPKPKRNFFRVGRNNRQVST